MEPNPYFTTQKPSNQFLSTLVDYYFFIDIPLSQLSFDEEFIIPFPRMTFGYFFNHPFLVTNHTLRESISVEMAISRISSHKITVEPQSYRVKIIGMHARPFCLAYLHKKPVKELSWLINPMELFPKVAAKFQQKIEECKGPEQMFQEVEQLFLDNLLVRDLSLIIKAVAKIDESAGDIQVSELVQYLEVSDKTIRTHFYQHVGCSPKDYIRLVKLKQVAFRMKNSEDSLTNIAYDAHYYDQAHFIHEVKGITGKAPRKLKKEIPDFRFLQF